MDWFLSFTTGVSLWLMGNKTIWGPISGLVNGVLWVIYALIIHQYGLILGTVIVSSVHVRNLILWRRQNETRG